MNGVMQALAAPFPPEAVSWRVGSMSKDRTKGMALAYIDARDVQDRLDGVLGPDWQDELTVQPNGLVTCRIGICCSDGQWRWRMDGTAAIPAETPLPDDASFGDRAKAEQEREMAQKGAASDAFKRAAVKWGIGRYLYSVPSPWVALDQYKRIVDTERPKLLAALRQASQSVPQPAVADAAPSPVPFESMKAAIDQAENIAELQRVWTDGARFRRDWPDDWLRRITEIKDVAKQRLMAMA